MMILKKKKKKASSFILKVLKFTSNFLPQLTTDFRPIGLAIKTQVVVINIKTKLGTD